VNTYYCLIGVGKDNFIDGGSYSILGGGQQNLIKSNHGFLGGGYRNQINEGSFYCTLAGGDSNRILLGVLSGVIAGGKSNVISPAGDFGAIGGGNLNRVEKTHSVIAGGLNNWSRGEYSAILGGNTNEASGEYTSILGGAGNTAGAEYSSVIGGRYNEAWGAYSIGGGFKSTITHSSNFMYADFRASGANFDSKAQGQFMARVLNGALFTDEDTSTVVRAQLHARSEGSTPQLMADQVGDDFARIRLRSGNALINHWDIAAKASDAEFNIFRNGTGNVLKLTPESATNLMSLSNGARLTAGGTWTNASDRNIKDNISQIDGEEILEKLAAISVSEWHYKTEADSVTHIGPMAQDFKAAFGLGDSDKSIATVDADGVNMAAIQALYKRLLALEKQNEELTREIRDLKRPKK
jgi:trimeric autotransporter adhesin